MRLPVVATAIATPVLVVAAVAGAIEQNYDPTKADKRNNYRKATITVDSGE